MRIQFEFPKDKAAALETLMKQVGIGTKKELMNNALTLFEWAVNERKNGNKLLSYNEETKSYTEILLPVFMS